MRSAFTAAGQDSIRMNRRSLLLLWLLLWLSSRLNSCKEILNNSREHCASHSRSRRVFGDTRIFPHNKLRKLTPDHVYQTNYEFPLDRILDETLQSVRFQGATGELWRHTRYFYSLLFTPASALASTWCSRSPPFAPAFSLLGPPIRGRRHSINHSKTVGPCWHTASPKKSYPAKRPQQLGQPAMVLWLWLWLFRWRCRPYFPSPNTCVVINLDFTENWATFAALRPVKKE